MNDVLFPSDKQFVPLNYSMIIVISQCKYTYKCVIMSAL